MNQHGENGAALGSPENVEISATAILSCADSGASLGARLRAGRERMGLSQTEMAARLKLLTRVLAQIEDDNYDGIATGLYLRGYLLSYSRAVGIPADDIESVATSQSVHAPLVTTGTISRSRYLFDRYSVSATYLILTGLIIGPTVWFAATHGGVEQSLMHVKSGDRAVVSENASNGSSSAPTQSVASNSGAPANSVASSSFEDNVSSETAHGSESPVIASLAPFPSMATSEAASPPPTVPGHTLTLTITQPSWVEVLASDGTRLEYGILPAGSERTYHSESALSLRIGNVDGTKLNIDGEDIDLGPYHRANVAHIRVFGNDATIARIDS